MCRSFGIRLRAHFANISSLPSDADIESWLDSTRDLIANVADRRGLIPRDFAATLICLISNGRESTAAHVGDGCAVLKEECSGRWVPLSWPDNGEYASTTFFVTDDERAKLRIARHTGDICALSVLSDGLERLALDLSSKQPFERFFDGILRPVVASTQVGRDGELSRELKTYLNSASVNTRTDDDKTLVLAIRK